MKILTPGHKYELANFEKVAAAGQVLQFIQKEGEPLKTVKDGTTNEEVLAMLVDRLQFLNKKLPSLDTQIAISRCEDALLWLKKRTQDRKARGVEGTHKA